MSGLKSTTNPYREEMLKEPREFVRKYVEDASSKGDSSVTIDCSLPVEIIKELKANGNDVETYTTIDDVIHVVYHTRISW